MLEKQQECVRGVIVKHFFDNQNYYGANENQVEKPNPLPLFFREKKHIPANGKKQKQNQGSEVKVFKGMKGYLRIGESYFINNK